jgi:hypothetical protein
MTVKQLITHAEANAWPPPPSDGAHRLGWWIGAQADGAAAILRITRACETSPALVDRLLSGEIEPAGAVVEQIAIVTSGYVHPHHWDCDASGGWGDEPQPREARA